MLCFLLNLNLAFPLHAAMHFAQSCNHKMTEPDWSQLVHTPFARQVILAEMQAPVEIVRELPQDSIQRF